jgi:tRNA-specific 2-thiouridylase
MTKVKALALFSGGLDSILAVKLMLEQGIDVVAVNFVSPFCLCEKGSDVSKAAKRLGVPLKVVDVGAEYLKMVRNPKHGYGKNMNPCVDCRIFILKKAKKIAAEIGADFIFTGEVLDERPMSQHYRALKLVEEEAGLKGKLLRPLSAKLLPATVMEKKGLVNRAKLLDIRGRSRKPQIKLAEEFNVKDYPSPAGGCLLTCKEYASKLRDLFKHKERCSLADVSLLKVGRHFRLGENKIVVGRNEEDIGSPITVLQGAKTDEAVRTAAALTAFYSDAKSDKVSVNFGRARLSRSVTVSVPSCGEVKSLRVG